MAVQTETRPVSGFSKLRIQGYGEVILTQGEQESLTIQADKYILQRIRSIVRDRRLTLGFDLAWWEWITWWINWMTVSDRSIRYQIGMKKVESLASEGSVVLKSGPILAEGLKLSVSGSAEVEIERIQALNCEIVVSGSSEIEIRQIECGELTTRINGSGEIELAGQAGQHTMRVSGSGKIEAQDLETRVTDIHVSGSATALVNAVEQLGVQISGAGTVRYRGDPQVSQSITGVGSVTRIT
jgi:hypothetical protein